MNTKYIQILRTVLVAAALALYLTTGTLAQSPSKILKQAEKALGGRKTFQAFTSVSRSGQVKRISDGVVGRYVFKTMQPNLVYERFELGDDETEVAFNGRSGWSRIKSEEELQTLTGKPSSDLQATASFRNNLWFNAKADKAKLSLGVPSVVDGRTTNVVILTTSKGASIKMYFDAVTGLLLREEVPDGDAIEVIEYGDYRSVDGVKQPFYKRLTSEGITYEICFDEIKPNAQIALSEFNFPVLSTEPLPDIPSLLKDLQANEDRVDAILDTYSYVQKSISRELGKDGVLRETESETVQLSFYKGYRIHRVTEKNGKPLSVKDQADADKDAAKQVDDIEKKLAKKEARLARGENDDATDENRRISIAEVLRASTLLNPRRERFRGRGVIVFDFEPNPAFDFSSAKSMLRFFGKTAGVMWIDEKDKQVARVEAVLFESIKIGGGVLAKLQKGASFTLDKERVNDEIWLPSQADINLAVRVLLLKGINVNQLVKSYDYHKFETEVKDAKVDEAKKP